MGRSRIALLGGAVLVAASLVPAVAHADARTDARRAFKNGMALLGKGKYEEGIKELERANSILPNANVTYNIARAYAEAGNLEKAIVAYKEYAATEPADKQSVLQIILQLEQRVQAKKLFRSGMDLLKEGKYAEGVKELEKAQQALPSPNITYNIARAQAALGNLEEAVASYKEYLKSNPSDKDAVNAIVSQLEEQIAARKANATVKPPGPGEGTPPGPGEGTPPGPGEGTPPELKPCAPGETVNCKPVQNSTLGPLKGSDKPDTGDDAKGLVGEARTDDIYQETIVTAARGAQTPLEAPNSTTIITRQDIQLSGITRVPELMRRVAGADVMQMTGGDTNVSIRGFNSRLSNKVLVLNNGRSLYNDILGSTYWETQTIDVDQIERIEVVRGPGSALYGANAFAGVVNIIPIAPGEGRSGARVGVGDTQQGYGSVWVTGKVGDTAYRASGGFTRYPRWTKEVSPDRVDLAVASKVDQNVGAQNVRMDVRTATNVGDKKKVLFGGGFSQTDIDSYGVGPFNDIVLNIEQGDVSASFESDFLNVRAYYVHLEADGGFNYNYRGHTLNPTHASQNSVYGEAEFVRKFNAPSSIAHDIHAGVSYRLKSIDWNYLRDDTPIENHGALFLQDIVGFGKHLSLALSGRLDYIPYLQRVVPSGRASFIIKPNDKQAIRISGSNAFRTPTFLESYLQLPIELPYPGLELISDSAAKDQAIRVVNPEQVTTAEISYLNQQSDVFEFELNAYYNRVDDLVAVDVPRPVSLSSLGEGLGGLNPDTGRFTVAYGGFVNQCDVYHVVGGELGARLYPVEGLDLFANYALNISNQERPAGCTTEEDQRTSQHKINAGVQLRTKFGLSGEVTFHYQTAQNWVEQVATLTAIEERKFLLPDYATLNGRIGFRFYKDRIELSGAVFNALADIGGEPPQQHPFGNRVGRRFMGFFAYSL